MVLYGRYVKQNITKSRNITREVQYNIYTWHRVINYRQNYNIMCIVFVYIYICPIRIVYNIIVLRLITGVRCQIVNCSKNMLPGGPMDGSPRSMQTYNGPRVLWKGKEGSIKAL
jgi:hypothetical protein